MRGRCGTRLLGSPLAFKFCPNEWFDSLLNSVRLYAIIIYRKKPLVAVCGEFDVIYACLSVCAQARLPSELPVKY